MFISNYAIPELRDAVLGYLYRRDQGSQGGKKGKKEVSELFNVEIS
jgi:hypothetical protein